MVRGRAAAVADGEGLPVSAAPIRPQAQEEVLLRPASLLLGRVPVPGDWACTGHYNAPVSEEGYAMAGCMPQPAGSRAVFRCMDTPTGKRGEYKPAAMSQVGHHPPGQPRRGRA